MIRVRKDESKFAEKSFNHWGRGVSQGFRHPIRVTSVSFVFVVFRSDPIANKTDATMDVYRFVLRVRRKNDARAPPIDASATLISIQKKRLTVSPVGVKRL